LVYLGRCTSSTERPVVLALRDTPFYFTLLGAQSFRLFKHVGVLVSFNCRKVARSADLTANYYGRARTAALSLLTTGTERGLLSGLAEGPLAPL